MSDAKGQHEPSMEEILASIRRIIAEDGDTTPQAPTATAPVAAAVPAEPSPGPARGEDVLELTDVVEEDGSVVSLSSGGVAKSTAEPAKREELAPEPPPAPPPSNEPAERLVSGATAAASVAALSQLAAARERARPSDLPLGDVGRTLEEMVREMLRPILRDWLDGNLPQLVERLVQDEIQRMVREAQGR